MADARIAKVTMPKWGLSMTSGRITEWLVEEGTEVRAGAELAEIAPEAYADFAFRLGYEAGRAYVAQRSAGRA